MNHFVHLTRRGRSHRGRRPRAGRYAGAARDSRGVAFGAPVAFLRLSGFRYLLSRAVLSCDDKGEPASLTGVDIDLGSEGAADRRVEGALRGASGIADADRAGGAFAALGAEDRLCPKEMDTLRQSENLYRSALQALPAHVAILDARGGIIAVNDAWKAFAANNQSSAISHFRPTACGAR